VRPAVCAGAGSCAAAGGAHHASQAATARLRATAPRCDLPLFRKGRMMDVPG